MRKTGILYFLVLFLCFSVNEKLFAQHYFEKWYGGTSSDNSQSVVEMSDGSIYVTGYTDSLSPGAGYDAALLKLNADGNLLWIKIFDTPVNDYSLFVYRLSDTQMMLMGDVVTGTSSGTDALLMKVDSSGNMLWKKVFGGPGSQSVEFMNPTADGNLIACGYSSDSLGNNNDSWFIKMDTAGNFIWDKKYGGALPEYSDYFKQTPDGGFLATSVTSSYGGGQTDAWLMRMNQNGDTLWTRTSGNQYAGGCQGLCLTAAGDVVIYGEEELFSGSWFNFFMEKYDLNGNFKWKKNFGGTGSDAIFDVQEAPDKGFYCSGYSNSFPPYGPLNLVFFKTDSSGNMLWKQVYATPGIEIGAQLIPSVYGGYIIAGQCNYPDNQYYVLHLDTAGLISTLPQSNFRESLQIVLYPNPTDGNFSLDFAGINSTQQHLKIELMNLNGEKILSQEIFTDVKKNFSVPPHIASGTYLMRLITDRAVYVQKIIIER